MTRIYKPAFRTQVLKISAFLLLASATAWSQATTSLRGLVFDPQGAAVTGAIMKVLQTETGLNRTVLTDDAGSYQFAQMPPGAYDVTVMKEGFALLVQRSVHLAVDTTVTLNLTLQVASTTGTVSVTAEAGTISTTDASMGNAFTQQQVRQLPLQTRNVVELLSLQPGVTSNGEVLGARRDQNNVMLDGVDVNDYQDAGIQGSIADVQGSNGNKSVKTAGFNSVLPIPLDSVQEFRVTVAGIGASEGRSSGGQVSLVTKSGTNQLHGSAYEFNRNTVTSANTWFNNRSGVARQPLVRNQFGASLGGPIIRNRIFYFLNYERRLDASGSSQQRFVPSASMKNGIFQVQTSSGVQTLSPADIKSIDPLHIGVNQAMLNLLKQYPTGNDPSSGEDGGLNFSGYRFNAPDHRDDRAYVGKMDFILDSAARHTVSVRGTLSNSTQDSSSGLAQFPGQGPASQIVDNSKGISAQYIGLLRPNLINEARFGFTRQGIETTGVAGTALSFDFLSSPQNYNARANGRQLPLTNFTDNMTWTRGKHTIEGGINFRFMRNHRFSYGESYPSAGYAVGQSAGLGEDGNVFVENFLRQRTGDSTLTLSNGQAAAGGLAALLGLIDTTTINYQYLRDGSVLPQGQAQTRIFAINEYEGYIGDVYRVLPSLTINYGLHYGSQPAPYETQGLQVGTTVPIQNWLAERNGAALAGIAGNAIPDARLTYILNGPANGRPSWFGADNNNFAPRLALAFAPTNAKGLLSAVFGAHGVFRAGAGIVYDHFGSSLITTYDQFGSVGLSTTLNNAESYNVTTSPRYTGSSPAQPAAPPGGFPYTPPDIYAIAGSFEGISTDLKAPYSYVLNANFARELPGKVTVELGYVGRLSHQLLLQGDVYTPLLNYKDPNSGLTWTQGMVQYRETYNQLSTQAGYPNQNAPASTVAALVAAKPSLIPTNAFAESMFPGMKNAYFPGSASANYFYDIYGENNGSYLDALHTVDRVPGNYNAPAGSCVVRTGCFTFFPTQGSGNPTWMNAGQAAFHAMTLTVRRSFSQGLSFDMNYTWSHSIDNASAAESGAGEVGAAIQNVYNQKQFRGSSDFDIRHQVNANVLYQLPFGKGKRFAGNAPRWLDQIVGGWQVSSIMRFSTGVPSVIRGTFAFNTSYWFNSLVIPVAPFKEQQGYDTKGNPSLFASPSVGNSFADQYPGQTGMRAIVRLAGITNFDIAAAKSFTMPWEGQRLQVRAEAFNAFNNVNFTSPSLRMYSPTTLGEYQNTLAPRVLQFAMRYEF